jgi:hypothetical protein
VDFITTSKLIVNKCDEQQATAQCTWDCWDCWVYNFTSTSKESTTCGKQSHKVEIFKIWVRF